MNRRIARSMRCGVAVTMACMVLTAAALSGARTYVARRDVTLRQIVGRVLPRPIHYTPWVNFRFEYEFDLPDNMLAPGDEPMDGDGRTFMSKDGFSVTVYGANNAMFHTLAQQYALDTSDLHRGAVITYRRMAKNWYVFSGRQGSQVFYDKTIYHDEQFDTLWITYSKSKAARYDPITAHIARSFRYVPHQWVVNGEYLAGTDPLP